MGFPIGVPGLLYRDCGNGNREAATIAVVTTRPLPRMVVFRSDTASVPSCSRLSRTSPSGGRENAAILDRHSTQWRSRNAVGAEEWLRRGQTKEWARQQVSCQDFVITIREGRHQFSWHKKQEQSRISPPDTVVVLTISRTVGRSPAPLKAYNRLSFVG
jgi:hypothetical protein